MKAIVITVVAFGLLVLINDVQAGSLENFWDYYSSGGTISYDQITDVLRDYNYETEFGNGETPGNAVKRVADTNGINRGQWDSLVARGDAEPIIKCIKSKWND